ncbi:hypothetical protein YC2023_073244 [Brassica napus]
MAYENKNKSFLFSFRTHSPVPKGHPYISALEDPFWIASMFDEYDAIVISGTFDIKPRPENSNILKEISLPSQTSTSSLCRNLQKLDRLSSPCNVIEMLNSTELLCDYSIDLFFASHKAVTPMATTIRNL